MVDTLADDVVRLGYMKQLTTKQLAAKLGISPRGVRFRAAARKVRPRIIGGVALWGPKEAKCLRK